MSRHFLVFFLISFAQCDTDDGKILTITPESGHIRVNRSTLIMCKINDYLTDCKFKIDTRETLLFHKGVETVPSVVRENGTALYTARYVGDGLYYGECGLGLLNVAKGFYVIGCQTRNNEGKVRHEVTTLLVDDSLPLRLKANIKYQTVEPGSDVDILCSSRKRQKLEICGIRLPTNRWLNFKKGHRSVETAGYHYNGRGLDKGDCGVRLLNVTEADSGVVVCHAEVGASRGLSGAIIRVGNLHPTTKILWDEGRFAKPGEKVVVECVMRGAYPLPRMIWRYNSNEVQCWDNDGTPFKEKTFQWMWEEQVKRQRLVYDVGYELGSKTLQCNPLEESSGYVCKNKRDPTALSFTVRPVCGIRTTTHYDFAYQSKVAKRETRDTLLKVSKTGEIVDGRDAPVDALSKILDTIVEPETAARSRRGRDAERDEDVSEILWDEVTNESLENVTAEIDGSNYEERNFWDPYPHYGGGYGFTPVISTEAGSVLNGTDSKVEFVSYPWMAAIYKNFSGKYEQQCGGTLVSETHVISAAHCFWSNQRLVAYPPNDYMIALGKIFRDYDRVDGMVQKRSVQRFILHPSWRGRKRNYQFDIAVIELTEKVVYTPRVAPACLDWPNEDREWRYQSGVVTGWGYTEDEQPSETLRYSNLPYVNPDTCFSSLPADLQSLLSADKFCAGFKDRNTSVCPGDSGGGILFEESNFHTFFLRGVVSLSFKPAHFIGKCYASEVTGFTMISESLQWLKNVVLNGWY